jgi:uncharacterized protein
MNKELENFIEKDIIPLYNQFDAAHDITHVRTVIENGLSYRDEYISLFPSLCYVIDEDVLYAACALHDVGLVHGRENHEKRGAEFVKNCKTLKQFFIDKQVNLIADAVLQHRASYKGECSSIYGKLLSVADRNMNPVIMFTRALQSAASKFDNISENKNNIIKSAKDLICQKFGSHGYAWSNIQLHLPSIDKNIEYIKDVVDCNSLVDTNLKHRFDILFKQN